MAYNHSPPFFLIRLLLFHFVLSQRAISVFAERPLRGRDGIKECVPCSPQDVVKQDTGADDYSSSFVPLTYPSSTRCSLSLTHVWAEMEIRKCYNGYVGAESFLPRDMAHDGSQGEPCFSLTQMKAKIAALDETPADLSSPHDRILPGRCYRPGIPPLSLKAVREYLNGLHSSPFRAMLILI